MMTVAPRVSTDRQNTVATVISMLHGRADIMERIKRQQADEPRPQQLDHRVAQSARTEAATTRAGETPFDTDTEILNADPQRSSFRPNEGASEISKPVLTSCFAMSSLLVVSSPSHLSKHFN